jgi:hypothetical protein
MSKRDADDRREYYRIEDTIALEFHPLPSAEAHASEALHDGSALFDLLNELHLLDFESQHLLRQISERDRTLASYLKTLNKRIDLLGQAAAQGLLRNIGTPRRVTLSENGMSFQHGQPMAVDSHVALKMVLMPQALGLLLKARIIHCHDLQHGQYEIGTEFEGLTETQRQLLARHILQKQALERRLLRKRSASVETSSE